MVQPGDTGDGVFNVGDVGGAEEGYAAGLRRQAEQLLTQGNVEYARLQQTLRDAAAACVRECVSVVDDCADCIRGQILRVLGANDDTLLAVEKRVRKPIESAVAECMVYAAQLGLPYPTPEDVWRCAMGLPPSALEYVAPAPGAPPEEPPPPPQGGSLEEIARNAGSAYRRSPAHYAPSTFRVAFPGSEGIKFGLQPDLTPGPAPAGPGGAFDGSTYANGSHPPALPAGGAAAGNAGAAAGWANGLPAGGAGQGGWVSPDAPPSSPASTARGNPSIPLGPPRQTTPTIPTTGPTIGSGSIPITPPGPETVTINPGGGAGGGITQGDPNPWQCNWASTVAVNPDGSTQEMNVACALPGTYQNATCQKQVIVPPGYGGLGGGIYCCNCGSTGPGPPPPPPAPPPPGNPTVTTGGPGGNCPPVNVYPTACCTPPVTPPVDPCALQTPDWPGSDSPACNPECDPNCVPDDCQGDDCNTGDDTTTTGTVTSGPTLGLFQTFCNPYQVPNLNATMVVTPDPGAVFDDLTSKIYTKVDSSVQLIPTTNAFASLFKYGAAMFAYLILQLANAIGTAIFTIIPTPQNCASPAYLTSSIKIGILSFINRFTGLVPPPVMKCVEQEINLSCQTGTPSTADICGMSLRGWIDNKTFRYGVQLNGDCPDWFGLLTQASQTMLTPDQVVAASRAGLFNPALTNQGFTRAGVKDDLLKQVYFKITEFLPGGGDLVSLMVRDAFDDKVAAKYAYDTDFNTKFTGKAKEWATRQGIPQDVMQAYWRAHWSLPSNSEAAEMIHRLRPGRGAKTPDGRGVTVTPADIRQLMQINDVAPGWIDALLALTYRPMTRVDIRRAYDAGILTKAQVVIRLEDLGYDAETSNALAQFYEDNGEDARAKLDGLMSANTVKQLYMQDGITDQEAQVALSKIYHKVARVTNMIHAWSTERTGRTQATTLKRITARYLSGGLDDVDLIGALNALNLGAVRVNQLLAKLRTRKQLAPREITAQTLCAWAKQGIITFDDYSRRMVNLGYTKTDAARAVSSCATNLAEKLTKELAAKTAKLDREAKAAKRAADEKLKARVRRRIEELPMKDPTKPAGPDPFWVEEQLIAEHLPPSVAAVDAG